MYCQTNGVRWYGHVLRMDDGHVLRKALEIEVKGKEEVRTTEEDMENASGEGKQECWFEKGGCIESSEMESGSWIQPPPFTGISPDHNWN